jgi:hypothetical protein
LTKRIQSAVGFDEENKLFCERHTLKTGQSMSDLINRLLKKYRDEDEEPITLPDGKVISQHVREQLSLVALEEQAREFLRENDHFLYQAKAKGKTGKNDLIHIRDQLFFSKFKVDLPTVALKNVLRDEIEKFDVVAYEKKKGLKKGRQ